ncbi:MAG: hypothetical protein EOO11_21940, partial [Chitinophagaceae bacterium]
SKKIAIFGCKSTTRFLVENLAGRIPISRIITIAPELAHRNDVADYLDMTATAEEFGIPLYTAQSYALKSAADEEFFAREAIDLAFVVGWQRLVPEKILQTFSIGVFGMHGSAMDLPLGRGRSPMNWAIIEGKGQFFTNLFRYDPGVDSGDVLDTYKFQITPQDTGETMHFKNTLSMVHLVEKNLDVLLANHFKLQRQSEQIQPTYYPKRSPKDSLVGWELDIAALERFIRAVAPPFNGAYSYVNGEERITLLRAQVFDFTDFGLGSALPGTVVQVFPNGKLLVKCYGGLLLVHEYTCGARLVKGDLLSNGPETLNRFARNAQGNFDIPE